MNVKEGVISAAARRKAGEHPRDEDGFGGPRDISAADAVGGPQGSHRGRQISEVDRAGKILKLYISISNFSKVLIGSSQIYVKMGFQGKYINFPF